MLIHCCGMHNEPATPEAIRGYAEEYIALSGEYNDPYEREKLIRDWIRKPAIAANVVQDFSRRAGDPKGVRVLDLGFGNGLYAAAFARAGARVDGLEVSESLATIGQKICTEQGLATHLQLYDGTRFPYDDATFEYAYTISVIEHVTDPELFLKEIARVLKSNGALYLTFPNRFAPRETHTGVYFLGYLPRSIAAIVMNKLYKRNTVEEINLHFLSLFSFMRLLKRSGAPLSIVFETESSSRILGLIKRALKVFGIHHGAILGHTMLVLRKGN